jgi:hypothetical protein
MWELSAVCEIVPNQKHRFTGFGRSPWAVAVAGLAAMLIAGCGAASGSTPSAASSSPSGFSAYASCLKQHGVSVPSPSGSPGSFHGFGGSVSSSKRSAFQKARQACASLRPAGAFPGGNFTEFASAIKAFRTCMSDHGEPVPTTRPTSPPAAGSNPADRFLNGLNPDNSKVAAAFTACKSKLPSFAHG